MNASLTTFRGPLEVFDNIGYIHIGTINARLCQGLIQQLPGRSDEGMAGTVLLISRLLAY